MQISNIHWTKLRILIVVWPDQCWLGTANRIVTIDKESHLVRLIHYTAQEYFGRNPIVTPFNAQEMITKTCVSYLLLSDIAQGSSRSNIAIWKRFRRKPFLRYAAMEWGVHARGEPERACRETILLLINDEKARVSAYQAARLEMENYQISMYKRLQPKSISKLSFAAFFGLTDIVKFFINQDEDIEAEDYNGVTPLMHAAGGGHIDTVEALLAAGAYIEKDGYHRCTALTLAAAGGHEEIVMALINKGANLEGARYTISSPLYLARRHGHINIANLLLEKGASSHRNLKFQMPVSEDMDSRVEDGEI